MSTSNAPPPKNLPALTEEQRESLALQASLKRIDAAYRRLAREVEAAKLVLRTCMPGTTSP